MDELTGRCVVVCEAGGKQVLALCVLDNTTSVFDPCALADDVCHMTLEMALQQLRPKKVMFTEVGIAC